MPTRGRLDSGPSAGQTVKGYEALSALVTLPEFFCIEAPLCAPVFKLPIIYTITILRFDFHFSFPQKAPALKIVEKINEYFK